MPYAFWGMHLKTRDSQHQSPVAVRATGARASRTSFAARTALCLVAVSALGGCGMSSLSTGLGGGMFGGSASKEPGSVSEADLLAAAKDGNGATTTGSTDASSSVAAGCPRFIVESRSNHLTAYEPGRDGDGLAILHRGEISKTARECTIEPGRVTVRYGFSGRVLLGPKGQPGTVTLPLQVAVRDAKRAPVVNDRMAVTVTIESDKPIGYFSTVKTVSFDVPEGSRPGEYELVVGFENGVPGKGA